MSLTPRSQLNHAYAICRGIARRAAKNFYYGFLLLPREKRNALSAVYAFMRQADDIADDPTMAAPQKRERLQQWSSQVTYVFDGDRTDDPVLLALQDAQHRFAIPPAYFELLLEGTVMDVAADEVLATSPGPVCYPDFDSLYQYCYHVASVVGLVCIRIFGYRTPAAEPLAEKCGIAFQLTNIIRDVKEDALLGRVYLPEEDLLRFGRHPQEVEKAAIGNGFSPTHFRRVLEFEAERAREYYKAADELLPMIDEDSRPALWAMVEIYRGLLEKIAAQDYDVFSGRVSLGTSEKLKILGRGAWQRLT